MGTRQMSSTINEISPNLPGPCQVNSPHLSRKLFFTMAGSISPAPSPAFWPTWWPCFQCLQEEPHDNSRLRPASSRPAPHFPCPLAPLSSRNPDSASSPASQKPSPVCRASLVTACALCSFSARLLEGGPCGRTSENTVLSERSLYGRVHSVGSIYMQLWHRRNLHMVDKNQSSSCLGQRGKEGLDRARRDLCSDGDVLHPDRGVWVARTHAFVKAH